MGVAARNIVLIGDQMQLAQPIQGTHPRGSGMSALEHLLRNHATVPPERGVFLSETRRMHPDLCGFVSAAVYEGRLQSAAGTEIQSLLLDCRSEEHTSELQSLMRNSSVVICLNKKKIHTRMNRLHIIYS